jgi:hypothetical protein
MRKLLIVTAIGEAATGMLLFAVPALAVRALFGAETAAAGILMTRIAGIALIGLGVACWPVNPARQQLYGMLAYSTLVMVYLAVVGVSGSGGILLWPAVALHAVLSGLLFSSRTKVQKTGNISGWTEDVGE